MLLRVRFDEHVNEIDMLKAKQMLLDGQAELIARSHPQPLKCKYFGSVGLSCITVILYIYLCS